MATENRPLIAVLAGEVNRRRAQLEKYRDYYLGDQEITFVGEKLQTAFGDALSELSCNRCGNVVDAISDRLHIKQFTDASGKELEAASEVWTENGMDLASSEVHTEALTSGDAYVVVWPDIASGKAQLFVNYADRMAVAWDADDPRRMSAALKVWRRPGGTWRANLYYPERLEKYESDSVAGGGTPEGGWRPYSDETDLAWPILYQGGWTGRVPVFHFANNARAGEYGVSELKAIIPLQDRYNLTLATLAIAEEHQSYRQRWAVGIQPVKDDDGNTISPFTAGAGQLWVSTSSDAKFGDFEASDLTQFEVIAEGWETKIARTARIPLYYLLMTGDAPSGEMLKTSEGPFVSKIEDRQKRFGATWSNLIEYVYQGMGLGAVDASLEWKDAASRSDNDFWQTSQSRRDRGVSDQQMLREYGYSDEEIEAMLEEIAEKGDQMGELMARAFNAGTRLQDQSDDEGAIDEP